MPVVEAAELRRDVQRLGGERARQQAFLLSSLHPCEARGSASEGVEERSAKIVGKSTKKSCQNQEGKKQIECLLGQWINGDSSGAILGFQGPPGVGKTTLAKKGLSKCLKDDNEKNRPFAFITLGGSSNGSTLEGHNYTYVGSTWGRIVDILMEKKCMKYIVQFVMVLKEMVTGY